MILNSVVVVTLRYSAKFSSFWANYVNVVEDKPLLSATEHRVRKKGATLFLPVTPRNSNRFSKFFYRHALQ